MSDWAVAQDQPSAGSDWAVVPEQAQAPADDRSFLQRGFDAIKRGAHDIATVAGQGVDAATGRMARTFGLDTQGTKFEEATPAVRQARGQQLARGVDDVTSLGYGQRLADAANRAIGRETAEDQAAGEQFRNEAAPEYRTVGQTVGMGVPGAPNLIGRGMVRALKLVPGAAKVAEIGGKALGKVEDVPVVGPAAVGTAKALGHYEATAVPTAALSASAGGNRLEAAKEAATDPAGIMLSTAAGAVPRVAGQASRGLARVLAKAPDLEQDLLLAGVARGEGTKGSATTKAVKLLDRNDQNVVDTLRADKPLRSVIAKPAKEALPVVHERMDTEGKKLDPHYDTVDKATGGVSMLGLAEALDEHTRELARTPLNEQYIDAVQDIKRSVLKAWAPEMEKEMAARKRLDDMGLTSHKEIPDVLVPTRDLRAVVTRLQKRGTQVINALNPGESSQMKADMATLMKSFIDAHLDRAAEVSPDAARAVDQIRDINKRYSALASMALAIEQRGWKEKTGGVSGTGHVVQLAKHGGAVAAIPMALHGNIPGAMAVVAAPHALPLAKQAERRIVSAASDFARSPRYRDAIQRLAKEARKAPALSDFVEEAVAAGMGAKDARRIWEAAHERSMERRGLVDRFRIVGPAPGLLEPGNVDLTNRPDVANPDGSHSSVRSMSFEENGQEILVPTVTDDGRVVSDDEAIALYHRTGKHLGKFRSPADADAYAQRLHEQQAAQMGLN